MIPSSCLHVNRSRRLEGWRVPEPVSGITHGDARGPETGHNAAVGERLVQMLFKASGRAIETAAGVSKRGCRVRRQHGGKRGDLAIGGRAYTPSRHLRR